MNLKKTLAIALAALAVGMTLAAPQAKSSAHTHAATTTSGKIAPVNINTATLAQLETLPGIGPKLAQEIIKHRPYKNAQELRRKVKGIGPALLKRIAPYVRFQ